MEQPIQYALRQTIVTDVVLREKWNELKKRGMSAKQADYALWLTVISKDRKAYDRKVAELIPVRLVNETTEEVEALVTKLGWRLLRNALAQIVSNELNRLYVEQPDNQTAIDATSSALTKVRALPVKVSARRK